MTAETLDLFDVPAETPPAVAEPPAVDGADRWRYTLDGPIVPRWLPVGNRPWRVARRVDGTFLRDRHGRPRTFETEADALAWIRDNPQEV